MRVRSAIISGILGSVVAFTPVLAQAPAHAGPVAAAHHKCTRTSSGTCIRGGEFCKQSEYGEHGWDAKGRRYTCKGSHTHPHWEK